MNGEYLTLVNSLYIYQGYLIDLEIDYHKKETIQLDFYWV